MRKCLYGILAAVFLCMWKVDKTDANNKYAQYFVPFFLYHEADMYYNVSQVNSYEKRSLIFLQNAREYVNNLPFHFVNKDDIIRQHIYIRFLRNKTSYATTELGRTIIMLNAFLTLQAFEAAVSFRACAFFYSQVTFDHIKYTACLNLSFYLEWYFSFMLEEKAEGRLKAENMCKIMRKLNLNFLSFPDDRKLTEPLEDDDNNVFKTNELTTYKNGERHFKSIFENYNFVEKRSNQSWDEYYQMAYYELWRLIMTAYTDKYFELFNYVLLVTKGLSVQPNISLSGSDIVKSTWDAAPQLSMIMTLRTHKRRGVVSFTNGGKIYSHTGSVMYRSNAVEILRQLALYFFLPTFINTVLNVYEIMKIINSSNTPKCRLKPASEEHSVDWVLQINITNIMPLLPVN